MIHKIIIILFKIRHVGPERILGYVYISQETPGTRVGLAAVKNLNSTVEQL